MAEIGRRAFLEGVVATLGAVVLEACSPKGEGGNPVVGVTRVGVPEDPIYSGEIFRQYGNPITWTIESVHHFDPFAVESVVNFMERMDDQTIEMWANGEVEATVRLNKNPQDLHIHIRDEGNPKTDRSGNVAEIVIPGRNFDSGRYTSSRRVVEALVPNMVGFEWNPGIFESNPGNATYTEDGNGNLVVAVPQARYDGGTGRGIYYTVDPAQEFSEAIARGMKPLGEKNKRSHPGDADLRITNNSRGLFPELPLLVR